MVTGKITVLPTVYFLLTFLSQGAIYTLDIGESGYATGGKDGCVKLWDPDFKSITSISIGNSPEGYKGKMS